LHVGSDQFELSIVGDLQYQWTGKGEDTDPSAVHDLVIGGEFNGRINSLKFYDYKAQPVMQFADGSSETTVVIGADGVEELALLSTGQMHSNGSALGLQRVAIHTDTVKQYASILSTDVFSLFAGQYVETLATDVPEIDIAALNQVKIPGHSNGLLANTQVDFSLFNQAHAQSGSSSFAWELINWIIPLESFGVVFQQLGYLITDPSRFQPAEFIIAFVDVLTLSPPAKGLKLLVVPLKAMTRGLRKINPKFMRYFAGTLNKVMRKAKKGEFDTLWNLLPFIVLAAEMFVDDDLREGLEYRLRLRAYYCLS